MSSITEVQQTAPAPADIDAGHLFIDGEWCDSSSGETAVTINPATEKELTTVAKVSGYGREHGPESLDAHTQVKTVWLELGR